MIIFLEKTTLLLEILDLFKIKEWITNRFKYPIGKFEYRQFYDYNDEFAQKIAKFDSIQSFIKLCTRQHNEIVLILFLLSDFALNRSILNNLNQDLMNTIKDEIENLSKKIYLEISVKIRMIGYLSLNVKYTIRILPSEYNLKENDNIYTNIITYIQVSFLYD